MNENMLTTVVLIGIIVLFAVGYFLYQRLKNRKPRGTGRDSGAGKVISAARGFARANGFRFLAPGIYQSPKGGKTGVLDAVVVGYFGVLGVKALGYNGEIYGTPGEEEWLQVTPGGERRRFKNPLTETSADMRALRDVLFAAKMKQVPVEIVCVFTAAKAQLAIPKNAALCTMREFKSLLNKDKYLADTGLDLDKLERALNAAKESAGSSLI